MSPKATVETTLNGLRIVLDAETGGVLKLAYPGVGTLLESSPDRAGVIDLAYPIKEFEPLRLAARYSTGAQIRTDAAGGALEVHWDRLGLSRDRFQVPGNVSTTVCFEAHPDGKSIVMRAEIVNNSDNEVRQILFPDFTGLLPVCGEDGTFFRTAGFASLPFQELAATETAQSIAYCYDAGSFQVQHTSGGLHDGDMIERWMDFGGLGGELSLFPKAWGFDPQVTVRLQRSEVEAKLRMMYLHDVNLKKGDKWQSPEYVLTPHAHGWAAGIEPFRAWVKQNLKREFPVPKHVREGIGFRSVFMCQGQPADPKDAVFRFSDLPKIAREAKEHGLDELVPWFWSECFALPLPSAWPHLGGEEAMATAVRDCKKIGVNVAPFISVLLLNGRCAPRYGAQVSGTGGWTYHTEMIPPMNPGYASGSATVQVGPCNKLWQEDVLAATKRLADAGMPSLCWDVLMITNEPEPNQLSLLRQIAAYARKLDPESTISAEAKNNMEIESTILDYTWNWTRDFPRKAGPDYLDLRPLTSVFPTRVNINISSSPLAAKRAFADSLYLNVIPRRPESINASGWIADKPALSKALKQCAALRKQFLPYFVDGKLIGDCILTKVCPDAHLCAYALPDRAIIVIINLGKKRALELDVDMEPWTKSASGKYEVKQFDADGKQVSVKSNASAQWNGKTKSLESEEMTVVEIIGK